MRLGWEGIASIGTDVWSGIRHRMVEQEAAADITKSNLFCFMREEIALRG